MIYFIDNGAGAIKIGFTTNLDQRMAAFRTTLPGMTLIASMEGSRGHERTLHDLLSDHHISGEWFTDCAAVRESINRAIAEGIKEWKWDRRRRNHEPSEWDERARRLIDIIAEGKSVDQLRSIEDAFDIPQNTLWRLRYRQAREVSVGEYFSLLRAASRIVDLKREAVEQQADLIRSLEMEDAQSDNALLDAERAYRSVAGPSLGKDP
jgi:hypothetical protein